MHIKLNVKEFFFSASN